MPTFYQFPANCILAPVARMRGMTPQDESELRRLCELIAAADRALPKEAPEREGLQKGALALHAAFRHGLRPEIESDRAAIGLPLSAEQQARLKQMGLTLVPGWEPGG